MSNTNKKSNKGWFVVLLESLSLKNQTRPQTANHVADGMATILAISFVATGPEVYYSFSLIVIVLIFIFACFIISKPKSRAR